MVVLIHELEQDIVSTTVWLKHQELANNIISINKNSNPDRTSIKLFINIHNAGKGQQLDTVGV